MNNWNRIIQITILAMLVYLTISVHKLNDKVFPDPNIMTPLLRTF